MNEDEEALLCNVRSVFYIRKREEEWIKVVATYVHV